MKKRYYAISISIVVLSFSIIAALTNVFNIIPKSSRDKVNYGNMKSNIESIEFYLYENCDETKEKKYVKMDYFIINNYFLLDDEFVNIVNYIKDNSNVLLKNNRCSVKDNCQKNNIKKIIINMDNQSFFVVNNMCNDKSTNELIDHLEKELNNLLQKKEEEMKNYSSNISLEAFVADNIKTIVYHNNFPWVKDDDIDSYDLSINGNRAVFSNEAAYFSLYKEDYEIDTDNWTNLRKYVENNLKNIDNPKSATCFDGGSSTITITLNNNQNYTINAYCGGSESFKNLLKEVDKAVGSGKMQEYEENVRKYNIVNDIIEIPISSITIIEEPGDIEYGFNIDSMNITFFKKEYGKTTFTKKYNILKEEWQSIIDYVNSLLKKNNNKGLAKEIIVHREDGKKYSSDNYPKFYDNTTYNKIISIIGENKFNQYYKQFLNEMK